MSYSVQHVRYTLECDACGCVKKQDIDAAEADDTKALSGWHSVSVDLGGEQIFCCPDCFDKVLAVVRKRDFEAVQAKERAEAES